MEAKKRAVFFLAIIAILAAVMSISLFLEHSGEAADISALRIGVGEGFPGLLMGDVAKTAITNGTDIDLHVFVDCCASSAQWAMGCGDLDVGFFCTSIAKTLVNFNSDLEIYGPAIMNSEVMALAGGVDRPSAIAVPQKRSHLSDLICDTYPSVSDILQASPVVLYNTLLDCQADGAVMDIAQAMKVHDLVFAPLSGEDYVSYCLVVRKDIVGTQGFEGFINAYNLIADDYNDPAYLENRYGMSELFWKTINVKFLYL